MSIVRLRLVASARVCREIYLSETSIGISGKKRLATREKIFTLTGPGRDSGDCKEGHYNEGEEGEEDREEEDGEEEEEVKTEGALVEFRIADTCSARSVGARAPVEQHRGPRGVDHQPG
jgi:hypothetical protein